MEFLIIDNDRISATIVKHTLLNCRGDQSSAIIETGKKAIVSLLDPTLCPLLICINGALKDISCRALVMFIQKQVHLSTTKVVVYGHRISFQERKWLTSMGVECCVPTPDALEKLKVGKG